MLKISKEIKVSLSDDELKLVKEFAERSYKNHYDTHIRNSEDKKRDIIKGKSAELALYKIAKMCGLSCSDPKFIIYETGENDGGVDLIINGVTCDVKCVEINQGHGRVPLPKELKSEMYIAVGTNDKEFWLIGMIDTKTIKDKDLICYEMINGEEMKYALLNHFKKMNWDFSENKLIEDRYDDFLFL